MLTQKNCAFININAQLTALMELIVAGKATILHSKHSFPAVLCTRISVVNIGFMMRSLDPIKATTQKGRP